MDDGLRVFLCVPGWLQGFVFAVEVIQVGCRPVIGNHDLPDTASRVQFYVYLVTAVLDPCF